MTNVTADYGMFVSDLYVLSIAELGAYIQDLGGVLQAQRGEHSTAFAMNVAAERRAALKVLRKKCDEAIDRAEGKHA